MRSRRIEVQRESGRKRLRRVMGVTITVATLLVAYGATRTPLLDVDHVRVETSGRTEAGVVAVASGIGLGEPMTAVDAGAAARRVEALPWVDEARVRRSWPGTIRIEVTERTPVAVVNVTDTRSALVDATGRVLAIGTVAEIVGAVPPGGVVTLTGVRGRVAEGEPLRRDARDALAVVDALREALPGTVTGVSTDLDATLGQGGVVRFGTADDLGDKIVAIETVLTDVDTACLDVVDVRVPTSPVLTRAPGCS
jgi:cell division protein FtsQ